MNEKLYIQDLINLLAEKKEITKKEAETFLKAFFEVIEQGLDQDKSVKIKGLGTFKLIRVESRESIDVNTGKRCVIEGHTKISFTPDSSVRDFINKPFSHFETVILNENVFFDETESDNTENKPLDKIPEEKKITNDPVVNSETKELSDSTKSVDESLPFVEHIQEEKNPEIIEEKHKDKEENLSLKSEDKNLEVTELKEIKEDKEEILQTEAINGEVKMNSPETEENENINAISEPSSDEKIAVEAIKTSDSSAEYLSKEKDISVKPTNKKWIAYTVVSLVSFFIVVSVIYYIFNPSIFENIFDGFTKNEIENTQKVDQEDNPVVEIITEEDNEIEEEETSSDEVDPEEKHFLAHNETELPTETEPQRATPQEILSDTTKTIITGLRQGYDNVKADSTSYRIVGTMSVYTLQSGETLTRVSNRFYGSKDLWPYLVMHNRTIIKNPDNVPSGTTIRIPALRDKE